jgi:hypothetical protein
LKAGKFVIIGGFVVGRNIGNENWIGTIATIINVIVGQLILLQITKPNTVTGIVITK